MLAPPLPPDESSRIEALYQLKILETPIEERFERITRLAKQLLNVPIVAISMVDSDRQWFKSIQGLSVCETSREISFCGHTILQNEIFMIPDALEDSRFRDNPLVVNEPHIRFYAGCPLKFVPHIDASAIGTLCAIDTQPRTFSEKELASLQELAALVESELKNHEVCRAQIKLIEELDLARFSSMVDPLTRLWNREGIERILQHEIEISEKEGSCFGIAMLDIDFFKNINDTYGHHVGDEILRIFSKHLIQSCRNTDGAGRWGGEEFLVLISSNNIKNVIKFATRILKSVETHTFKIDDCHPIKFTVTIGLAFFEPGKNLTMNKLLKMADEALYKGKSEGRNRVIYT